MSLKALQGFVRIVELDSFSEAADALFLSQSALSQQIRALEAQLKVQLFQHAQRRVVLTPAGWEFYPKAKQLLELYDDAVNCAQAAELNANPPKRHLLIGHQNMPLQMLGFDLFAVTEELSTRFSPLMYSCANRKDIWRALITVRSIFRCRSRVRRSQHEVCIFTRQFICRRSASRSIRRQRCPADTFHWSRR